MSLMLRVKYAQLALQGPDSAKQAELNLIWTELNRTDVNWQQSQT